MSGGGGSQKGRVGLYPLFEPGESFLQEDMHDFIKSFFNLSDDIPFPGSWIQSGTIPLTALDVSALTFLNSPLGLRAWDVDNNGNLLPFASGFQDLGSPTDIIDQIFANNINILQTAILPSDTTIGPITPTELSYLDGVTSPIQTQIDNIISGAGGVLTFTHVQPIPATTWTITHNKNTENLVYTLYDENNYEVFADSFRIVNLNIVEFTFAVGQLGKVNLILY